MDLSTPIDEGTSQQILVFDNLGELESFRSTWRHEIQKGREARSSVHQRTESIESSGSPPQVFQDAPPGRSEEDILNHRIETSQTKSPLEVYEAAILKERQGSLSEAVIQYRKAFKMDPDVDKQYKQKYFPTGGTPSVSRHLPNELPSGYSTQEYHHSTANYPDPLSTLTQSLTSLSLLRIEPENPDKPCYLANIPDELLLNILLHLSLSNLDSLSRASQVCRKLFVLSQGENSLYKELCMHYFSAFAAPSLLVSRVAEYNNDWRRMLIERPRLRFDGCYIATCHYLRPGGNDFSWNTPIHMVTYFRFVRFYADGSCITVLTTSEPKEVVHSISWTGSSGLKGVSYGAWRMSESGAVSVEVKGPKKYNFIKDLQSTSRGKHNKFVWMGFHSVNQDNGERTALSMTNEKSYYFSKVRSYGDE